MRYPAAEQLEIIRLVEQSPLPARHTLAKLGIPRATFYRCSLTVPPSILVWLRRAMSLWRSGPQALGEYGSKPEVSLPRRLPAVCLLRAQAKSEG